jgi:hypothetical protein
MMGFCKHGNEPPGSIKGEEFLEQLGEYRLVIRDSSLSSFCCYYDHLTVEKSFRS